MKTAVVMGGGGARGAYEMGAWTALRELDMRFDIAVGTSIGSINAALFAQDAYDLADTLWAHLSLDQIMADGINLDMRAESLYGQRANLLAFLKSYAHNRGADVTPLHDLLKRVIDEKAVRASKTQFGLVTVRFPSLSPMEMALGDIPEGRLVEYLMASAAIFPAFPMYKIDDELYLDGGYYDTLPVNLALNMGAESVVAIDLMERPTHPELFRRPWVRYVRRSQPLGGILNFEPDALKRNRQLGYLDTLRAFGKVRGVRYSFDARSVGRYTARARAFSLLVARTEASLAFANAITRAIAGAPLTDIFDKEANTGANPSVTADLLCGAETCATILEMEPDTLYTLDAFNEQARALLPLADARALCGLTDEEDYDGLLGMLAKAAPRLVMTCLYLLIGSGKLERVLQKILPRYQQELLGACYLHASLD